MSSGAHCGRDMSPVPHRSNARTSTYRTLANAQSQLPALLARNWIWWSLPTPKTTVPTLASIIEDRPSGVAWHTEDETRRVLRLMTGAHRKKVQDALRMGDSYVGTIYKRTRPNRNGEMTQRAEVRFDGISGCLRTPVGGSSRQTIIVTSNNVARTRLLSPREAARLMGVPDDYRMPLGYNDAYHLFGDGVVVPVVGWLERHLLRALAASLSFQQVA